MKHNFKTSVFIFSSILSLLIFHQNTLSQDRSGKYGIGVIASSISPDFFFKYWSSASICFQPAFGFTISTPKEGDTGSIYRLGLGILGYKSGKFSPYSGVRVTANLLSGGGETYSDIGLGGVFGVEYFFNENFSIGGEFQITVWFADDDFSPSGFMFGSTNYGTGQFATVNFYFK